MASTVGAAASAASAASAAAAGSNNSSTSGGYTSNSNGNFSGGNISNGPLGAPTAPGTASGDYGFGANLGWTPAISMDGGQSYTSMNVGTGESFNSGSKGSGISVDGVFGKDDFNPFNTTESNKQGDYAASSKTESNIETDTFSKQDVISLTPQSVEENKGVVDNQAIDSVEGLVTEQKDKEGQDVLDASKKRSEAEEEDAANNMRDNLKALNNKEEAAEEENNFQIGDRDEDVAKAKSNVDQLAQQESDMRSELAFIENDLNQIESKTELMQKESQRKEVQVQNNKSLALIGKNVRAIENLLNTSESLGVVNKTKLGSAQTSLDNLAARIGIDSVDLPNDIENARQTFQAWENNFMQEYFEGLKDFSDESITAYQADIESQYLSILDEMQKYAEESVKDAKRLEARKAQLQQSLENNKSKRLAAEEAYNNLISERYAEAETPTSEAQKSYDEAMEAISNSKDTKKAAIAQEALGNVETSRTALAEAIDGVNKEGGVENASPQAVQTLMDAYSKYDKALKAADNKYKGFKGADFSKPYAEAITFAKNFDVTLADGSKQSFADYATEMATKSPVIAAAMYEAKAQQYEEAGHKVLAALERGKANIMKNNDFWSNLARPFLGADNKARAMFINMSNVNMRATYNAYDNVLKDPNATSEQKAEAKGQIAQANALMTAATALDASTGIGGWGDNMTDGEYGVTDPGALNGWQNFNAHVSNFAQALLGLGVTPAANKAYQKAYYLNPDADGFMAKDFDGDGFVLTQEYGNNAAAQLTFGGVELATGVALCFEPATLSNGINMITDAIKGMYDSLFGIRNASKDTQNAINTVLNYFRGAAEVNGLPSEVVNIINQGAANIGSIDNNVNVFENFQLKSDEVGNLDNWLEGSGSNTATNEKFNQSLSYDEWLKLIESDDVMKEYAKKMRENAKKGNVDKGVNA